MKKNIKVLFSILLTCIMFLSVIPVHAATNTENGEELYTGLEGYISKSKDGTLIFDSYGALEDGYDLNMINSILSNINYINYLVKEEGAILNDDFSATLYVMSTRARGVSKTVVHWYGLTEVWMNSDDTAEFINALEGGANASTWLSGKFGAAIDTIVGVTTGLSVAAVKAAAAPGRGIIMYSQYDGTSMSTNIWFASQ